MKNILILCLIFMVSGCSTATSNIESTPEYDPRFYKLTKAAFFDLAKAKQLIDADPSIVHAKNSKGESAYHFLVVENDKNSVKFLLEHGSNINNKNASSVSAICEAVGLGYFELVEFLLQKGANSTIKDCQEEDSLYPLRTEQILKFTKLFKKYGKQ